jgi:hypothetical protein
MGTSSSQVRSTGTGTGHGRHRTQPKRHLEPYNWLGAGAITFSIALGAALVSTPGIAEAAKGAHHWPHTFASSHASGSSHTFGSSRSSGSATTHTSHQTKPKADTTAAAVTTVTGTTSAGKHLTHTHPLKWASETSTGASVTAAKEDTSPTDAPADTGAVSDVVKTLAPFANGASTVSHSSSTPKQLSVASLKTPAVVPLPDPLTLIGAAIAYDIRGIQHQMNPLVSGVLGLYHLQLGVSELKDLHVLGASLDLLSGALSLAIVGLSVLPIPGASLLIPPTAVLAATTATVNTIGQGLFHW